MDDDITEDLAELDDQIRQLEHLANVARECQFAELEKLLRRDLLEAQTWRAVFTANLPASAQKETVQ